jgi:hypothetical protein
VAAGHHLAPLSRAFFLRHALHGKTRHPRVIAFRPDKGSGSSNPDRVIGATTFLAEGFHPSGLVSTVNAAPAHTSGRATMSHKLRSRPTAECAYLPLISFRVEPPTEVRTNEPKSLLPGGDARIFLKSTCRLSHLPERLFLK